MRMKKLAVVLLIPILIFSLISCDGNIRAKLADAMGKLDSNVWIETGAVKPSTVGVEGVANVVNNVTTDYTPAAAVNDLGLTDLGITVAAPEGVTTVLKPQTADEKKALEDSLSTALNSSTQTQQLVQTMSQPAAPAAVTATQGSMKVAAAALTEVANLAVPQEIKDTLTSFASTLNTAADSGDLTQADVVTMQLVTNLVSTTAAAAKTIADAGGASVDFSNPTVKAAIDDSLFVVNVAQQLSGVGSLDLTQMLNLSDLMSALGSRSLSRTGESGSPHELPIDFTSKEEAVRYVNQIGKIVVAYVGATDEGKISEADYNRMVRSLNLARSSYDNAMALAAKTGANASNAPAALKDACGLTGMMNYAVAVVFSELDKFGSSDVFKTDLGLDGMTVRAILESMLVNSPDLLNGTMTASSKLYIGETYWNILKTKVADQDALFAKLKEYAKAGTLFATSILNAYDTIEAMSDISGNTIITTNLTKDKLLDWFNSLND